MEDLHGTATILAFKDAWQNAREILQQDVLVLIRSRFLRVATDPDTLSELKELFGKSHVSQVKLA